VAVSDEYLYGVDRATGKRNIASTPGTGRGASHCAVSCRPPATSTASPRAVLAIDARSGRTAWTLPGEYSNTFVGTAAADGVVYFQGRVAGVDTGPNTGNGILHAVDVQTRQVLWSFSYPTGEAWSFGIPVAADEAIYVGTYQTLLKLK